ncbi:uncharacterized protein LOC116020394 [Ipomoea triloba]|uniref:uncharacterized protein LOC116020394 n=1 Tax=Ipomoea triloba TaxID=35885 RepID=UPI00125DFB8F|nr:uncharacterized protein LOC116020394 [Ipomoea triloba]
MEEADTQVEEVDALEEADVLEEADTQVEEADALEETDAQVEEANALEEATDALEECGRMEQLLPPVLHATTPQPAAPFTLPRSHNSSILHLRSADSHPIRTRPSPLSPLARHSVTPEPEQKNTGRQAGSPFDSQRAEPSQKLSVPTPQLDMRRAESSRQHVTALNTQFARLLI